MQCNPSGSRGKVESGDIATREPALSGAEILRLRLRMTTSERACNDRMGRLAMTGGGAHNADKGRHEAKASHYETDHKTQGKRLIGSLSPRSPTPVQRNEAICQA